MTDQATQGAYTSIEELMRVQSKARGFSFLPRQPIHSLLAGRHASRLRGRGLNFEEIRGYLPGDDIRNMDWRVTARLQEPHVRVYTEERDRPVILLIDQRIGMFFGSKRCMKSVIAAEAAALAAWRVLSVGDRVGAIVFNDSECVEIRPHRSHARVMAILSAVVKMNRQLGVREDIKPNPAMLHEALKRCRQLASHDFLICLISDAAGGGEEAVRYVTELTEHNDVLSLFTYDPLEASLPKGGSGMVMGDGERQLEVDTTNEQLREKFRKEFEQRLEWLKKISRQRSIPLLPISTEEDVPSQIRRLLGRVPGS